MERIVPGKGMEMGNPNRFAGTEFYLNTTTCTGTTALALTAATATVH